MRYKNMFSEHDLKEIELSIGKMARKVLTKRSLSSYTIDTDDGLTIEIKRKQSTLSPRSASTDDRDDEKSSPPKKRLKKVSFTDTSKGAVSPTSPSSTASVLPKYYSDFWDKEPLSMSVKPAAAPAEDTKTIKAEQELLEFLDASPKNTPTITAISTAVCLLSKNDDENNPLSKTDNTSATTSTTYYPVSILDEEEASSPSAFYAMKEDYDEEQWKSAVEDGRNESVDW